MNEEKSIRLSQVARKLNVGTETIVSFLSKKGFVLDNKPNAKITNEQFNILACEFSSTSLDKKESTYLTVGNNYENICSSTINQDTLTSKEDSKQKKVIKQKLKEKEDRTTSVHYTSSTQCLPGLKSVGKIILSNDKVKDSASSIFHSIDNKLIDIPSISQIDSSHTMFSSNNLVEKIDNKKINEKLTIKPDKINLSNQFKQPTIVGKMNLPKSTCRKYYSSSGVMESKINSSIGKSKTNNKKIRDRLKKHINSSIITSKVSRTKDKPFKLKTNINSLFKEKNRKIQLEKKEQEGISSQEIESQIKKTLAKLNQGSSDTARSRHKRDNRRNVKLTSEEKNKIYTKNIEKVLKITEFISANELASFMNINVNEVLSTCMSLGMIVSINQRLDAESITVVADEFNYSVEFVDVHEKEIAQDQYIEQESGELLERPPIVTIMGHVDHGKTSLLDSIRTSKITSRETGGITQHIGAYDIITDQNKKIVFLDTPGHEAFTAMRTRGANITDIIIIVIAADDSIMMQTKESISHAQIAGCPIIIAINKIDKLQANIEKVKEDLANLNILVEDWGGKYQCQEISAKTGKGVNELLEKILLEASLLNLQATPSIKAKGTIIESFLDPGRGYVSTGIVQDGTLRVGDIVIAGVYYGKVKAILNYQNIAQKIAYPSTPVQILGLNGAPRAGDIFRVMNSIKEASELAQKKQQLLREQTLRTKSHLTLDEITRRLSIGTFKELNIIIKGDMDGSIEALGDALLSLSHEEVKINILHKCVGAVSESDVLLASATESIIIAFHIKPSAQAKKLAEIKGVEIKQHSIIYSAIDDVRHIIQGLLTPTIEEVPTGRAEVKKIFTFSKIGNIAGCQVRTGFIKQSNPVRVIRKDQVIFVGYIHTIKHGLEEINQVKSISECGIHIKNFELIEIGDIIEGFERKEIKKII